MSNGRDPYLLAFETRQRNWLERIVYAVGAVGVIVVGFFFLTAALIAGALLLLVVLARLWWLARKLERARRSSRRNIVEGEYEVVERSEFERHRSQ